MRLSNQVDLYETLRDQHEDGVLAYFVRRTRSADLAWGLAGETWAAAQLRLRRRRFRRADAVGSDWLFALARETLCASLRAGHVVDDARRKAGTGAAELTVAGARWVEDVATEAALADLVAALEPALREAIMAPLPRSDAEGMALRLRAHPAARGATTPREDGAAGLFAPFRMAR